MAKIFKFFIRLSGQRWGVACKETNMHTVRELPVAAVWLLTQGFSVCFLGPRNEIFSFFEAEACEPAVVNIKNKERVTAQLL